MKTVVGIGYSLRTLDARVVNIVCDRQRSQKKKALSHSGPVVMQRQVPTIQKTVGVPQTQHLVVDAYVPDWTKGLSW